MHDFKITPVEVWDDTLKRSIRHAIDYTPIHFLGIYEKAQLEHAYFTGSPGLFQVYVSYGPYGLHGLVNLNDPNMSFYMDYSSVLVVIQETIKRFIAEYDTAIYRNTSLGGMIK